ncbi:MAG: sodium-dependent transporter [Dehalococcoidia bacterium]|nr:sodium-dependent transporter [Dehalococcoidia bacterium]
MAELARERWGKRSYFVFAALGSAIGLGNLWRFPHLTYSNGGGAFLVAWMVGLLAIGIPWLIVEYGMGKYFQRSAPGVFEGIGKKWEWLGWWPVWVAFLIDTYYTVVMAWALRYVVASGTVAWGIGKAGAEGAADYYFGTVLQLSDGPANIGTPVPELLIGLAVVWVIIFLVVYKGASVIGPVSQWVMITAWAFLVVLVVRGVTLTGATQGLNYFLQTDWSKLASGDVWFAALSQIAFTLSVGMAGMYAYGSFIKRRGDVNNNAFITGFGNCATSFFAGFAVFSVVGFLMQTLSIPVGDVSSSSVGLAFITWPVAISMLPGGNALFGIIFFLCLFLLGLSSAYFLAYGGVIAPLMDKFGWGRTKTTVGVCVVAFLIGILFTTNGGLYWGPDILDRAVSFYGLLITGALSCIVIGWVFPARRLREFVNESSDFKVGAWFDFVVKVVIPAALIFVLVYGGFMNDIPNSYGGYPRWASNAIWGTLIVTLILSFILGGMKGKGRAD